MHSQNYVVHAHKGIGSPVLLNRRESSSACRWVRDSTRFCSHECGRCLRDLVRSIRQKS
jgi:hypothetical protein